jgi:hypothetical protein
MVTNETDLQTELRVLREERSYLRTYVVILAVFLGLSMVRLLGLRYGWG